MAIIKNIIQTTFTSKGAESVTNQTDRLNKSQTRLAQSSASAGRSFAAQSQGLGGLVAAYAGAAATTFALQQAFDALARSARAAQTLEGLRSLAENAGQSSTQLLASVREITKNQLTLTEAAQQINLSLSAGFNTDQIERLGGVALKASRALGRDLTDAYTRVIRGSAKLETELLDELGIYTRIDPAVRAYASATNKAVSSLTDFERRQAFVNAVITEGERKFKAINTTLPTTSEKIEAFGTSIVDAATKIGIFFAEVVAPLAEFLTNNLAGSFGAVGIAASLVAAKGVEILEDSISKLAERAEQRARSINKFFLEFNKGSREAQKEARSAISGINLSRSGLVDGIGTELKALKDVANARSLSTEELKKANEALKKREAALRTKIASDSKDLENAKASRAANNLKRADLVKLNEEIGVYNKRLESNNKLLKATETQLLAVGSAANRSSASVASFFGVLTLAGGKAITGVLSLGAGFIGLAGSIIGLVSIASLLGSVLASLTGKQQEYNAVLEQGGKFLRGFFTPSDAQQAKKAFSSLADGAISDLEKIDQQLKEVDEFKFKSKIVSIEVDIEKTKEDLSREVSSALADVARQGSVSIRENLVSEGSGIGAATGAAIGAGIGGFLGSASGPFAALGIPLGVKIGGAIGAGIGTAIGAAYETFLDNDLPRLTAEREQQLAALIGDSTAFEGESGKALSQTVKILDDQLGVASSLTFEGRRYLRTQIQTAQAIIDNKDNILTLQAVAERLNITAEEVRNKFKAVSSEIEGVDGLTLEATLDSLTRDRQVKISLTFVDQTAFITNLDQLLETFTQELAQTTTIKDRRGRTKEVSLDQALNTAQSEVSKAQKKVDKLAATLTDSTNAIVDNIAAAGTELKGLQVPDGFREAVIGLNNEFASIADEPTVDNIQNIIDKVNNLRRAASDGLWFFDRQKVQAPFEGLNTALLAALDSLEKYGSLSEDQLANLQELADAQSKLEGIFKPDKQFIAFIRETVPKSLEDIAINTENAGLALANFSNLFNNLISQARSGNISLESFAQTSQALQNTLDRTGTSLQAAESKLARLVVERNAEVARSNSEETETIKLLDEQIASAQTLLQERQDAYNTAKQTFNTLADQLDPILQQVKLTETLRKNFNDLLTQNNSLIGLYDKQGSLITETADREAARQNYLIDTFSKGEESYERRLTFEKRINEIDGLSLQTKQAILGANAENAREILSQLVLNEDQKDQLNQILFLTAEQNLEAGNTSNVLNIVASQYINQVTALTQITAEINKQNQALQTRIGILQAQNAVAAAQRNLSRIQLDNTIARNSAQLDIRKTQAELNALQIEENKASGSGNNARKQALELLKSELEFRQTISTIESETTKRRLEANLEAAQKTKQAFEEVTSVLDLSGALTGIGAILTNQLELIELERQQAEEKYANTMETLAIERELLEAEMTAASGAKAASEELIQKELEILKAEQKLELDAQSATLRELEAKDALLDKQRSLAIDEANAEAEKARADIAALRAQGEQNLSFLNNKADLDQDFLDKLAELITKFAQAANPDAAVITAGKITKDFKDASDGFSKAIKELEASTDQIYGQIDESGQRIGGLVFDEIESSFSDSKAAIEAEIAALKERTNTLVEVQALELSNAEAQLRAQKSGGESRLAELEAQLKAIEAQEAKAGDERARAVEQASIKQAKAIQEFATEAVAAIGKFITARKQEKINALIAEENQLKDILAFQTESLTEAQTAASDALQEEISLREKLKDATESLIESQTSYLDSLGGEGNVTEASKQFIDTLLDQKQAIFDLQRATRSRIAADGRVASLESAQAQLADALAFKTAQRIEAEANLEKTQKKLALITKVVSGEIGKFIGSLANLGSSLAGLSGGGSFGQVFSNVLGLQNVISGFSNLGNTFAAAANKQVVAANVQNQAANTLNNATAQLTGTTSTSTTGAVSGGAAAAGAALTGQTATSSALTFTSIANAAFAGAGIGSLVGALTGDVSWASTIGGAVGSTLATVFAGSTFVSAVSGGIATLATSAGFAASTGLAIASIATPLVFAAIGALIFGALFGKKKKVPSASIAGTVTGEGFDTTSVTGRNISQQNLEAIESIPEQVFAGFISSFEAAGLQFRDSADVTIDFYNGQFRKIQTTFSGGLSTTATNIGKSAQDAADELERQFFRLLGPDSFAVDQFTPSRERIQQVLRVFGEIQDLDQKTRERFIEGLTYAQEFDEIVRSLLATSVDVTDIFNTINSAAKSLSENKLNEYLRELGRTSEFFGTYSDELGILQSAIRTNILNLLGLAEAADGTLISTKELSSELNAGAVAIRNIMAETTALRATLVGLSKEYPDILTGVDINNTIIQALSTRLSEFVNDFGQSLALAIEVLKNPAKIVLVDLEKFIVNGVERIRQATGVYDQLLLEQANGIEVINIELSKTIKETLKVGESLEEAVRRITDSAASTVTGLVTYDFEQETQTVTVNIEGELSTPEIINIPFEELGLIQEAFTNIDRATELLNLELEGFISTISDKAQLQAIIDGAEAIDTYAGAIARSAAEARLAEINEIERTQATQQFNKVSREFTKRLQEITGVASGLFIGGEGVNFIDVLEAFGTTEIDQASREFKGYLDLINAGTDISANFNSAIDFLNDRFDNGETDSLKFVSALDLLQRVTLDTIESIEELTNAYENTLQQISDAFNTARSDLLDSVSALGDELVSLIENVSDKTQDILGIYDDAVSSVTESASAIFDLQDAAKDAFKSAEDVVAEYEKANNLSGKTAAQLRAELSSIDISISEISASQTFDLDKFLNLSSLTTRRGAIQRELKRLEDPEYEKALNDLATASENLAFVEDQIVSLGDALTDPRSTKSEFIQDTINAVEEYTTAQATLGEVTAILTERGFDLTQTRIDETDAVIKLNTALRELDRDTMKLDTIIEDILKSSDSTLREAFIQGAIGNLAGEIAELDETARDARIAEVSEAAGSAFDMLVPLATSILNLADSGTVNSMTAVSDAANLTTDTFATLLGVFNTDTLDPVSTLVSEINRFSGISLEIANVSEFSAKLLNLGAQSTTTATDVAALVSDLTSLEAQIDSLTGDSGVDSLREVFTNLAKDLQTAWDENVILGLPDVINLSAISVAPDGGLNELKTIATNSTKYAYIKAVGADGMGQALFRAEGGYISGPGTSTSDSIPAQLSNGEYVIKASTVKKIGLDILNNLNSSGDLDAVISSAGRFGDSKAAHINPAEIALLKKYGGSGTRNPRTGILEFFGGASSGANAYGGLFSKEEAAYINKIQKELPNGQPSMQSSLKANYIDVRKLNNTYLSTVGNPIDLLSKGGADIMSTESYDSMQNQMLSSTMAMDTLATKRGLSGINSQTQGFGMDKYKSPKKRSLFSRIVGAIIGGTLAFISGGALIPVLAGAFAGAAVGGYIEKALSEKAGEQLSKDIAAIYEDVSARDLGRGGYDVKNSSANKVLINGNTILERQSDLNKRYSNVLTNVLGNKAKSGDPAALVDAYNNKEDMFFDFYMLQDAKIPAYNKQAYTAKNSATGGLVKALSNGYNRFSQNVSGQRDSIPTMLEPGEFVLRKPAVDRMGVDAAVRLNSTGNVDSDVNVEVNVINNSSPVTPTIKQTRRENGKIVVDVILEDVRNNGPIRQALKGIR